MRASEQVCGCSERLPRGQPEVVEKRLRLSKGFRNDAVKAMAINGVGSLNGWWYRDSTQSETICTLRNNTGAL